MYVCCKTRRLFLAILLVATLAGRAQAEVQNSLTMSLPSLKPGQTDVFTASDAGSSDSGNGSMYFSVAGVLRFTLNPSGATGRYSTVTGSGAVNRSGVAFDTFKAFRSFLTNSYLTVVSSASNTCPNSAVTYNWLDVRARPSDVTQWPMDAASANYLIGGTFTYDAIAAYPISGGGYFNLAGPTWTNSNYRYTRLSGSTCSNQSVKMEATTKTNNQTAPLDMYGTLNFGSNSLMWISSGGNPLVAYGIPQASLNSMSSLNGYVLSGIYSEFLSKTSQTQKDIFMIPDSNGSTFTLRQINGFDDNMTYTDLGTLTCTNFNSPATGFCKGTLTLNGVGGTGKAVCLPNLPTVANGHQNVIACLAQKPSNTNAYVSIVAFSPAATSISITPTIIATPDLNSNTTATYVIKNLSGRPVYGWGSTTFASNSASSTSYFSTSSNTCSGTLNGYASCTLTMNFSSGSYQLVSDTFRIGYQDGSGATPNATALAVGAAGLTGITVTPAGGSSGTGTTQQYTATGNFTGGGSQNITNSVTWSSSNPSKATVAAGGLVTMVAAGSTTITATLGSTGTSGNTGLTVVTLPPEPSNFTATPTDLTVPFTWTSGGGSTAGFKLAYNVSIGATAPADCASGTVVTLGNVTSYTISPAIPGRRYAARLCSYDGSSVVSNGVTFNADNGGHTAFVTSTIQTAALGGLKGADALCATRAAAGSATPTGSKWKAILSTNNVNAIAHIQAGGKIYNLRPSGSGGRQIIANNEAGLFSGTLLQAWNYDENGATLPFTYAWTNFTSGGGLKDSANSCSDYTSSSGATYYGTTSSTTATWADSSSTGCGGVYHVYCIDGQQYLPDPPKSLTATPVAGGKMDLAWSIHSNNSNAYDDTAIRVYRSTDNATFTLAATTSAHATTYQDTGLSDGTTYYYKVAAINYTAPGTDSLGVTYESDPSNTVSASAFVNVHRMFVTSTTYTGGAIGGIAGADAKCQTRADAAALGGTWRAMLSSGTASAYGNLFISAPTYNLRPSGSGGAQQLATNRTTFWSFSRSVAVGYDEFGTARSANVWTNINAAGNTTSTSDASNCTSFTSTSGTGYYGGSGQTGGPWAALSTQNCTTASSLYCIDGQTDRPAAPSNLAAVPVTGSKINLSWQINSNNGNSLDDEGIRVYRSTNGGSSYSLLTTLAAHTASYQDTGLSNGSTYYYKVAAIINTSGVDYEGNQTAAVSATASSVIHRIFVTNSTWNGNLGGVSGADAKCQAAANAQSLGGTWKAWLGVVGATAASRVTISGPVYDMRPAGLGGIRKIANDSTEFYSNTHQNLIEYSETGVNTFNLAVWTNSTAAGAIYNASYTCTNFTSNSGSVYGIYGSTNQSTSGYWAGYTLMTCSTLANLYCIDGQ